MVKSCVLKASSEAFGFLLPREWQDTPALDVPRAAKFGVISFSQMLEAVWSRGYTGGSSVALSKLSNKQERSTGRMSNQSHSDLLFFPSPFVLKLTRGLLICCSESCQMEMELLPSEGMVGLRETWGEQGGLRGSDPCMAVPGPHSSWGPVGLFLRKQMTEREDTVLCCTMGNTDWILAKGFLWKK